METIKHAKVKAHAVSQVAMNVILPTRFRLAFLLDPASLVALGGLNGACCAAGMWIHPVCCKYKLRVGRLPVLETEIMAARNGHDAFRDRPAAKDSQKSLKKTTVLDNDSTLQS
ncbi:Hypothetical predicted protein [Olea europaea subsp. europaea]|uniref:Uncharacterized protein n=1 Tax=Olea europaea subsp. europaea TaxID=158383 RepID=A0A8S0PLH0_OLEEU|nr:Hypothetical predicted protein [Olea europaea subsp. europaea]